MSNTVLDENLRQLFRHCTPRLTAADVDRALARFEGRRRPAPTHARVVAAAAAALVLAGVLGWLALSSPPKPVAAPAQQVPAEEIAKLIADLGAATPDVREKAKARLLALGPAALEPLQRAIYHEDPEVRVASQAVAKIVRRSEEIRPILDFNRAAIKIARARWTARNFTELQAAVGEAFDPDFLESFLYVPRKSVGAAFDLGNGGKGVLTPELVAILDGGDGIVYLDTRGKLVDLGPFCLFTLPDKVGWSAFVVLGLGKRDLQGAMLLEINVAEGEGDRVFQPESFALLPEGGLKIVDLDPKSNIGRVLKKGDVIRSVNGKAPSRLRDLDPLCVAGNNMVVVAIDRDGKLFSMGVRVLVPVILKKPSKTDIEAGLVFEQAERAYEKDPKGALPLYLDFLSRYAGSDFLTAERKQYIRERIAVIKERKSGDK